MRAIQVGAAVWVVFAAGLAGAQQVDKAKVRQAVLMPTINLAFNFSMNPDRGCYWQGDKDDVRDQIRSALEAVAGNPSDPFNHANLARLYDRAEQPEKSRAEWDQAERAYRLCLRTRPNDPTLLAGLSETLDSHRPGAEAETEALLRKSLSADPNHGRSWEFLGALMSGRAIRSEGSGKEPPPPWSPEVGRQAETLLATAEECYDRAIRAEPTRAELYFSRAMLRERRATRAAGRGAHTPEADAGPVISDMWEMARLQPDEPLAIGVAVWYTVGLGPTDFSDCHQCVPSIKERLRGLSERQRAQLDWGLGRLRALGLAKDPRKAAGALTVLGYYEKMVLEDEKAAEGNFRRAIALDPTREAAWDGFMGCLLGPSRSEELLNTSRERLRQKETPRNHLLLAKAYQKVGRTGEAEGELRSALRLDPKDVNANLGMAVLALKRGETTSDPGFARPFVAALDNLGAADQEARRNFAVLDAARHALEGDAAEAKQLLRIVLETDHGHSGARSLLAALEP